MAAHSSCRFPMEGNFLMDLGSRHTLKCQEGTGWRQPSAHRNLELPQPLCPALNTPRAGEAELRVLLDFSSGLSSPIPSFSVYDKIRTKSVVFCFLFLGALIPFFHCHGLCSRKSHLVSVCAPVCFSSPLLSTCHFCSFTLCQYLLSLPIFPFLNHFILFPAHPNQHHFESHILFLHKIEAPFLKSPKVATTSTMFLSNPYSAVLFLALVFSSRHPSVTTPSLSLFISLSPPPLHFSPKVSITQPHSFACISQLCVCCRPTSLPLLFQENPTVCSFSQGWIQLIPASQSTGCLRLDNGTEIRALICCYSQNQLQMEIPAPEGIVTFKESKSSP